MGKGKGRGNAFFPYLVEVKRERKENEDGNSFLLRSTTFFPSNLGRKGKGKWHEEHNYKIILHFFIILLYNKNITVIYHPSF